MATQYTSLLGLALPVQGELSGTWGDIVNNAITSLLDTAVAGTTTLSTDGDVTLSTTTGASNQARQAIILWNPASGTTTRNITAPAQSKIYTVINASGGTQSIVFRGAGPTTGVTIIKGESAVVAWNGSDFIKISNTGGGGSFTNVTISGTTTLSGLTASTALALNASKEVVSVTNTGTGNNVLATSPTLVTPALGTPSALVGTNITGTAANFNINGTVGATTPATGAFTTLTTSSTVTINGGTANGVAYLNGSKVLTTGSALVFDGTNLGVGVTPSAWSSLKAMQLPGGAIAGFAGGTGNNQFNFFNNAYYDGTNYDYIVTDTAQMYRTSGGTHQWHNAPSGTAGTAITFSERMRLSAAGGLSIGTTTDAGAGGLITTGNVTLGDATTDTVTVNGYMGVGNTGGSAVGLWVRNTALTSANQNGILVSPVGTTSGTSVAAIVTSPGTAASVYTATALYGMYVGDVVKGAGSTITTQNGITIADQTQGVSNIGLTSQVSSGSGKWNIYASGTAQNYFAGNVGIGTTTPANQLVVSSASNAIIQAVSTSNTTSGRFYATNSDGDIFDFRMNGRSAATNPQTAAISTPSNSVPLQFNVSGVEIMRMTNVGLGIGTTPGTPLDASSATNQIVGRFTHTNAAQTSRIYAICGTATGIIQQYGESHATNANELRIASPGALAFQTAGTLRAVIDSSGNLGIGTSSPAVKLDVVGAGVFKLDGSGSTTPLILRNNNTASTQLVKLGFDSSGTIKASINAAVYGNDYMTFNVGSDTERMRIDSSGNVGIGTSSPGAKLDVNGSFFTRSLNQFYSATTRYGYSGTTFLANGSGSNTDFLLVADTVLNLGTNGSATPKATLDSSGNLGLGVTPSAWDTTLKSVLQTGSAGAFLTGQGSSEGVYLGSNAYYNGGWKYVVNGYATHVRQQSGVFAWYNAPSGTAGNAISFTQAMTLHASGGLSVGSTTDPGAGNISVGSNKFFGLDSNAKYIPDDGSVGGALYTGGGFRFFTGGSERARIDSSGNWLLGTTSSAPAGTTSQFVNKWSGGAKWGISLDQTVSSATAYTHINFSTNGTTVGNINANNTATTYATSSDYRLKDITGPITTSGAYIDSLNPVEGTWKADGSNFVGLIAHEVQEASRTQVATGVKDGEQMQGMDYSSAEMIANMIAELKSLRARVAALESI